MRKYLLPLFITLSVILSGCEGEKVYKHPGGEEESPKPPRAPKEKMLWFDSEANFELFSTKAGIEQYVKKAAETGFDKIVVDVRNVKGESLYPSSILPMQTKKGSFTVNRDFDYLEYFLETARKYDMKVTVSMCIFPAGRLSDHTGLVYDYDDTWDGKTCVEYTPTGLSDIKDAAYGGTKVAAFLNPVLPEVQRFALSFIEEVVTKYDFDAFALDYCRYPDGESDFSQATKAAFEEYIGETIPDSGFPSQIFTYSANGDRNAGKYYKQWWEFRSHVITDMISQIRSKIKSLKPEVQLEYWAASWWQGLYLNGQNWASRNYDPSSTYPTWASPTYKNTGFARELDTFLLGAYLSKIYGANEQESIEYAINRAYNLIGTDCNIYGTISAPSLKNDDDIAKAVYLCLERTKGLMVFDISQVIEFNLWDKIKAGIDKYESGN